MTGFIDWIAQSKEKGLVFCPSLPLACLFKKTNVYIVYFCYSICLSAFNIYVLLLPKKIINIQHH